MGFITGFMTRFKTGFMTRLMTRFMMSVTIDRLLVGLLIRQVMWLSIKLKGTARFRIA